jgi:transposase
MFVTLLRIAAGGVFLPVRLVVARHIRSTGRNELKSYEGIMEILEAFDLTKSFRAAGELAGCSHHTVEHYVALRDAGMLPTGSEPVERARLIDPHLDKIEEWVERSKGKVRGDVVFERLGPLGYTGSDRTARRVLAQVKVNYRAGRRRVYRPWIPEPGMWAQWDWGHGPRVAGRQSHLWCGWLAWSRFRVVIPTWDKTLPTVISCLDRAMGVFDGCPTYWLTDNERTVTTDHVAGIPVRHPVIVAAGHHYGVTIATCVVADPETKGGSESTVRIAKADLVPTDANLRDDYTSWAELVDACETFMAKVNNREHRITRRPPAEMLKEERARLHRLPATGFSAAFGETRKVSWSSTVSFGGVTYSVPHKLIDESVWVRVDGDEIIATHMSGKGAVEVARHLRSTPGTPRIDDTHYPPRPPGPLNRQPKAANPAESEFLALGEGARLWLIEGAAAGTARIKVKMAEAVTLARLHGVERVDWALGHAATFDRFADGDLVSILAAHPAGERQRAEEGHSMQPSTKAWEGFRGGDPS